MPLSNLLVWLFGTTYATSFYIHHKQGRSKLQILQNVFFNISVTSKLYFVRSYFTSFLKQIFSNNKNIQLTYEGAEHSQLS